MRGLRLAGGMAVLLVAAAQADTPSQRAARPAPPPAGLRAAAPPVPPANAPRPATPPRPAVVPVVARPPPPPMVAIYAALPPSAAYGIGLGPIDRLMVHARAQSHCLTGVRSDTCRPLLEFEQGCGALAHGSRDPRLLPIPYNPNVPVSVKTTGTGPTRDQAEREAVAICQTRDRGASCVVVAAACVGGTAYTR